MMRTASSAVVMVLGCASLMSQGLPDAGRKIPELERRTQQYLQEQKPQLAIQLLREIILIDTTNLNAQANLGVLLFFDNKHAEAIPHLRAALKLQPDLSRIQALLGIAEKRTGDTAAAQNDLAGSFEKLSDAKIRIQAGLELIELYQAAGQLNKAQSIVARLEESDPQNPQVLFVNHQIARQIMDHTLLSLMLAAPDSAEMHMVIAGELARQGDRTNAIAHLRDAIRLNAAIPGAHFALAEQLRPPPHPTLNAQAEGEYKAAVRANPYDELSWRQLAGIVAAEGDFKTAEEGYRKALALQPTDSDTETGLAIVLISLNRAGEAIALLESALKHDPTHLAAHYRLSMLYRRAGRLPEADREMETFRHYQEIKDKLGRTFKQLAGPPAPQ
jgi:tetratricopeptide (TPR) repeat protein